MDPPPRRTGIAEATLGAFRVGTREVLVPLLLYKSVFLGEWFQELVRHERDPEVGRVLLEMSRQTLGEAISMLDVMRGWEKTARGGDDEEAFVGALQRRLLLDLLVMKEGSNEAVTLAAMRAPTNELRDRLLRLADVDRRHGDALRSLLGSAQVREALGRLGNVAQGAPLGAHEARRVPGTLGAQVEAAVRRFEDAGVRPERLVVSHVALRHLRDEGRLSPDHTAFGLYVDVDLGWEGECWSFVTTERVRLTEMVTMQSQERPQQG